MKRALIIGSSGQDGILLGRLLQTRGYDVTGVSRTDRGGGRTRFIALDVSDANGLCDIVREVAPDEVYYLAAHHHSSQEPVSTHISHSRRTFDVNLNSYVAVLDMIAGEMRNVRVFYACSSLIFGRSAEGIANETTPFKPQCLYSIAKLAGLHTSEFYRATFGLHVSVGILFNHESPYRSKDFLSRRIADGVRAIVEGRAASLTIGTLQAECDWGYAEDFVEAMWMMLQQEDGDTYVVASGELHSVRDWVEQTVALAGLDPSTTVNENPALLSRRRPGLIGDSSKLRIATGWAPRTPFFEMVNHLYRDSI